MTENNLTNEHWLRQVTTPLGQARVPCSQCSMQGVCEALAGDEDDKTFVRRGRLGSGQTLFHAGDVFHGVYAVTSGAIKTYALLDKEDTQVVDFHFPGDTVGLEAIDSGTYTYTARALTETLVCRVDVDNPHLPGERQAGVQQAMIRALSEQLRHEQSLSISVAQAECRAAHRHVSAESGWPVGLDAGTWHRSATADVAQRYRQLSRYRRRDAVPFVQTTSG